MSGRWQGKSAAALLVAAANVASMALGLAREVALAARFGASRLTDAYLLAFLLVNSLYRPLAGGMINAAALPILARHQAADPAGAAVRRIGQGLLWALGVVLGVATALGLVGTPLLVRLVAPGFGEGELALTATMTRILLPALVLIGVAAGAETLLYLRRRFSPPAASLVVFNALLLGAVLAAGRRGDVLWLTVGTAAAFVALPVIQLWSLRGSTAALAPPSWPLHPDVGRVLGRSVPLSTAYFLGQLNQLVERVLATHLPAGRISALSYAFKITSLPQRVIGVPVATVLFPHLADLSAGGDRRDVGRVLVGGMRMILFLTLPVAVGLSVLATPLVQTAFQRGAFASHATEQTASALAAYAAGIPMQAVLLLMQHVLYALQAIRPLMLLGAATAAINLALDLLLMPWQGHVGLAWGFTATGAVAVVLSGVAIRRRLGPIGLRELATSAARMGIAAGGMAAVLGVGNFLLDPAAMLGSVPRLLATGALAGAGLLAYLGAGLALRLEEIGILRARLGGLITPGKDGVAPGLGAMTAGPTKSGGEPA